MEKHILILTTTSDFLGKFELENVKILQHMGYTVHYASNRNEPHYFSDEERIRNMGVHIHPIDIARSPFLLKKNYKALHQLLSVIRQFDIQVLHCHTPVGGLLGRLAGRLCRSQNLIVIYTAHGFHFYKGAPVWNRLFYYPVEKYLARYTDILIVINEEDFRMARKFRLKKGGRLYKIPGVGIDRTVFRPISEKKKKLLRIQRNISPDDFFLLSIGELNENKNHKIVLEALVKFKNRYPDCRNIKYGICGDGFYRKQMEQWVVQMGLTDIVVLYGYCTDIPQILGCADVTVFPSKREGLGMVGLESLAMGIPVIASDNRGTREYMEHGKNGFVCRYDDIDGFVKGIEVMKNLSKEKKKKLRICCLESVKPFDKLYAKAVMTRIYSEADHMAGQLSYEKSDKNQCYHERI